MPVDLYSTALITADVVVAFVLHIKLRIPSILDAKARIFPGSFLGVRVKQQLDFHAPVGSLTKALPIGANHLLVPCSEAR